MHDIGVHLQSAFNIAGLRVAVDNRSLSRWADWPVACGSPLSRRGEASHGRADDEPR